jgi:hypothetical protein
LSGPKLAPQNVVSSVNAFAMPSSRATTTRPVPSRDFLTWNEQSPNETYWRPIAFHESSLGKTRTAGRGLRRSSQPYMKTFILREWPCRSKYMTTSRCAFSERISAFGRGRRWGR